jgi:hypothetical protein
MIIKNKDEIEKIKNSSENKKDADTNQLSQSAASEKILKNITEKKIKLTPSKAVLNFIFSFILQVNLANENISNKGANAKKR